MIYLPSSERGLPLLRGGCTLPYNINTAAKVHNLRFLRNILFNKYLPNNYNRVQRRMCNLHEKHNHDSCFLGFVCFTDNDHSLTYPLFNRHSISKQNPRFTISKSHIRIQISETTAREIGSSSEEKSFCAGA